MKKKNRELIKGIVDDIQWVQEYIQAVGEEHKQVYVDALENAMKQLMTIVKTAELKAEFQASMQVLRDLIEHKDSEIARWQLRAKEEYEKGFAKGVEEGMAKAWSVADAMRSKYAGR